MSGLTATATIGRSPRAVVLAVVVCALAGILVSLAAASFGGSRSATAPERPFGIVVPSGWSELTVPGSAAAIRRDDGKATLIIKETAPVHATGARLVHDIGRELRARFPGFKPVSARFASVRGGRAFVYTFVHGHTVQMLALVSAHGHAYAIDGVSAGGAPDAARQLGAVVRSFGP